MLELDALTRHGVAKPLPSPTRGRAQTLFQDLGIFQLDLVLVVVIIVLVAEIIALRLLRMIPHAWRRIFSLMLLLAGQHRGPSSGSGAWAALRKRFNEHVELHSMRDAAEPILELDLEIVHLP